jgi:glycosyltransferase involved in cell wall biosynthesis
MSTQHDRIKMKSLESPPVIYWNNIPSPYMVERFQELARRNHLSFEAWFNARLEPGRSWEVDESQWNFRYRYVPTLHIRGRAVGFPIDLLRSQSLDLLVSLYSEPSFVLGQLVARHRGIRTALWVETTFDRWIQRRAWKDYLKRQLFSRADAILTTGPDGHSFALRHQASPGRIHTIPHYIDAEYYYRRYVKALVARDARRNQLGLCGVTYLYVGRLWSGKGLEFLLQAFATTQRQVDQNVSLLLVGDGVDENHLRRQSQQLGLRNVVFAGFKQKAELPLWYALADIFVFPTLGDPYGLVVEEAMACSLPVIATTAAGEIRQRVSDGLNGYLVPPASSLALAQRMQALAGDPKLRARMSTAAHERVRNQGPARWAQAFENVVERLIDADR